MRRSLRAKNPWTGEPRTALSTGRTGAEATPRLSSSPGDGQGVTGGWAGRWYCTPLRDAPYHMAQRVVLPLPPLARLDRARTGGCNLHTSQKRRPVVIPSMGTRRLDGNVGQRQPVLQVWCGRCSADHTPECQPLHWRKQGAWGGQSEKCALLAWERQEVYYLFFNMRWIMDGDC
jgi:hypothetical protein